MEEATQRTAAAKLLVAARRQEPRTCQICGAVRVASPRMVYCSNACRQRAKYQRHRAKQQEPEPGPKRGRRGGRAGEADG